MAGTISTFSANQPPGWQIGLARFISGKTYKLMTGTSVSLTGQHNAMRLFGWKGYKVMAGTIRS